MKKIKNMKLIFEHKAYEGKYDKNGKLIIPLNDISDILFFKNWQNESRNNVKKDYIKEVNFTKITEHGTLINCFPILHENEDSVELVYDYSIIKTCDQFNELDPYDEEDWKLDKRPFILDSKKVYPERLIWVDKLPEL